MPDVDQLHAIHTHPPTRRKEEALTRFVDTCLPSHPLSTFARFPRPPESSPRELAPLFDDPRLLAWLGWPALFEERICHKINHSAKVHRGWSTTIRALEWSSALPWGAGASSVVGTEDQAENRRKYNSNRPLSGWRDPNCARLPNSSRSQMYSDDRQHYSVRWAS